MNAMAFIIGGSEPIGNIFSSKCEIGIQNRLFGFFKNNRQKDDDSMG
jgi:hypothetical protein